MRQTEGWEDNLRHHAKGQHVFGMSIDEVLQFCCIHTRLVLHSTTTHFTLDC